MNIINFPSDGHENFLYLKLNKSEKRTKEIN